MRINLPEEWRDDRVLGFFTRHFVPIYLDFRRGDEVLDLVLSAFAFSVLGRWLLMTAGHCITDVETLRNAGWQINRARLMDGLNARAEYLLSVPFDYDSFHPTMLGADRTFDYGIFIPTLTAIQAMKANHVVPLEEAAWDYKERDFGLYKLLGAPNQRVGKGYSDRMGVTTMFQRVDRLKRRPEGFPETNAPMFYGKLRGDPRVKLHGMSGGPIFGFVSESGRQQYWLVAMQVSTMRTKYISGMLMKPLGEFIHRRAKELAPRKSRSL